MLKEFLCMSIKKQVSTFSLRFYCQERGQIGLISSDGYEIRIDNTPLQKINFKDTFLDDFLGPEHDCFDESPIHIYVRGVVLDRYINFKQAESKTEKNEILKMWLTENVDELINRLEIRQFCDIDFEIELIKTAVQLVKKSNDSSKKIELKCFQPLFYSQESQNPLYRNQDQRINKVLDYLAIIEIPFTNDKINILREFVLDLVNNISKVQQVDFCLKILAALPSDELTFRVQEMLVSIYSGREDFWIADIENTKFKGFKVMPFLYRLPTPIKDAFIRAKQV